MKTRFSSLSSSSLCGVHFSAVLFSIIITTSSMNVAVVDAFGFMKHWKSPLARFQRDKAAEIVEERFGDKKLVVITSVDSPMGQRTARALLDTGEYHVIGGVSDEMNRHVLNSNGYYYGVDEDFTPLECNLNSFRSVRAFADQVDAFRLSKPVERLVCFADEDDSEAAAKVKRSPDGHEVTLQRHFLAPILLTSKLLPALEDSTDGRVLSVMNPPPNNNKHATLSSSSRRVVADWKGVLEAGDDGSTAFEYEKALADAQLCQKMLTNYLHEKYHKLTDVCFHDYTLTQGSNSEEDDGGLFEMVHDQDGITAEQSGKSWTLQNNKLAEHAGDPQADAAHDINAAYDLFHLSEQVTNADWPSIKVVTSPCPTLKVIGAVTKGQVKKQELKRMREFGRPGINEGDLGAGLAPEKITKRQKVVAVVDKAVSFILKHTLVRAAKIISNVVLGAIPQTAIKGSYDDKDEDGDEVVEVAIENEETFQPQPPSSPTFLMPEKDVAQLEEEIFQTISKENANKKEIPKDKKLVVITGTSSGLGRKTALALLRTGEYHVIGAVRDLDKMEAVAELDGFDMDNFTPMYCEQNSFDSVREFCANVETLRKDHPLDTLICNAGVYQPSLRYAKWSKDMHEQTMQINFLSHYLMISLLMNSMRDSKDPRITMVGSVTGNDNTVGGGGVYPIADLHDLDGFRAGFKNPIEMADGYGFIGAKAYKDSKLCLMILGNHLHAKYHRSTGIAFSTMYPGCIAESPLFREKRAWFRKFFPIFMKFITGGFVGEHEAGQRLFQVAHDPRCKKSGVYWSWNGGPREGRGAEALEKGGQISGGGGAGGGWDSIFENDQSGKVLNVETGFELFQYAKEITGAEWPDATNGNVPTAAERNDNGMPEMSERDKFHAVVRATLNNEETEKTKTKLLM